MSKLFADDYVMADRWLQMQPRNYGKIGSSLYTMLSIQCEEAMSRVFNMQTYLLSLLNEAFLFSLDSPRLVLAYIFPTEPCSLSRRNVHSPFPRDRDHQLGSPIYLCRSTPISCHDTSILAHSRMGTLRIWPSDINYLDKLCRQRG